MKIKLVEFKNRVEKDSIVSLDIYFTIDNAEIVHKGSFRFERKHYFFIEAKFYADFNEKQTTEITKNILGSRSKKLAYAVTRPVSKVKEKVIVMDASVSSPMDRYCNMAMIDFKLQGEEMEFGMNFYNEPTSDNAVMYMYTPLYRYASEPHDCKEIAEQVIRILNEKNMEMSK